MPLYRNLRLPLNMGEGNPMIDGEGRGVFPHTLLPEKSIEILEQKGKIARISTPPLEIFPGWKTRGAKLAKEGIETAEQFYDADNDELAKILKVKPDTIASYKEEVIRLLTVPKPRG